MPSTFRYVVPAVKVRTSAKTVYDTSYRGDADLARLERDQWFLKVEACLLCTHA